MLHLRMSKLRLCTRRQTHIFARPGHWNTNIRQQKIFYANEDQLHSMLSAQWKCSSTLIILVASWIAVRSLLRYALIQLSRYWADNLRCVHSKPGGHLFLSTIARTPLAHFLTIFMAENVLRLNARGTHTYSKYINPHELDTFFRSYGWMTGSGPVSRLQAETRGMVYIPWTGQWILADRGSQWAEGCNYLFWVRKPASKV